VHPNLCYYEKPDARWLLAFHWWSHINLAIDQADLLSLAWLILAFLAINYRDFSLKDGGRIGTRFCHITG